MASPFYHNKDNPVYQDSLLNNGTTKSRIIQKYLAELVLPVEVPKLEVKYEVRTDV